MGGTLDQYFGFRSEQSRFSLSELEKKNVEDCFCLESVTLNLLCVKVSFYYSLVCIIQKLMVILPFCMKKFVCI